MKKFKEFIGEALLVKPTRVLNKPKPVKTLAIKKPVVATPTVIKPDEFKHRQAQVGAVKKLKTASLLTKKKPGLSEAFADPNTHPMSPLAVQHGFEHQRSQGMLNAQVHVYKNPKSGATLNLKTSSGMGLGGQQHSFSHTDAGGNTKSGTDENQLRGHLLTQNKYV